MADVKQSYDVRSSDAPPSYDEIQRNTVPSSSSLSSPIPAQIYQTSSTSSSRSNNFKPIVIPQTSSSLRGAFFSPFARAYSPILAQHSISPQDFLPFIDGLNEAFIATPGYQIASSIGSVLSHVPIVFPLRWAGRGISEGTGLISEKSGWSRARETIAMANERIFLSKGLKCTVLKTGQMMAAVGHGAEMLNLPPLERSEFDGSSGGVEDPRMRRIRALGDRVAPLTFDGLPPPGSIENWWKRNGSKEAQRKDARMHRQLMEERAKGAGTFDNKKWDIDAEARKYADDLLEIEMDRKREIALAEKKLSAKMGQVPEERVKIEFDLEKDLRRLDREKEKVLRERARKLGRVDMSTQQLLQETKEQKVANKIYWIVIHETDTGHLDSGAEDDVDSLDSR